MSDFHRFASGDSLRRSPLVTATVVTATVVIVVAGLVQCGFERPASPVLGYETNDQACNDRIDNDYDSMIDCEDPDCVFTSSWCGEIIPPSTYDEPADSILLWHDQIDNDDNGQFDCAESQWQSRTENSCSLEVGAVLF